MKVKTRPYKANATAMWAHAKLDGHFLRVVKDYDGIVHAYTSNPTDITAQLPESLQFTFKALPWGFKALGELWVPNRPASYVKSALKRADEAIMVSFFALESAPIEFVDSRSIDQLTLPEVERVIVDLGLSFAPYETLSPIPRTFHDSEIELLLMKARRAGLEGWVLKSQNLPSGQYPWWKIKCERTIDLIVTDTVEGQGKYLGMVGALVCSLADGREVANVSGMTDEERYELENDPVGRVVEVQYQYVGAGGRLRHPRFVRFRDDKLPAECTADQDDAL